MKRPTSGASTYWMTGIIIYWTITTSPFYHGYLCNRQINRSVRFFSRIRISYNTLPVSLGPYWLRPRFTDYYFIQQSKQLAVASYSNRNTSNQKSRKLTNCQDDRFLVQVRETVENVFMDSGTNMKSNSTINLNEIDSLDIESLPRNHREPFGIARRLHRRMQAAQRNNDCPRCWMQQAHCFCDEMKPIPTTNNINALNRIFVLMHHKEICLHVDTAKIILAAFPDHSRLVVGGIPEQYQSSMKEMMDAIHSVRYGENTSTPLMILYPSSNAITYNEIIAQRQLRINNNTASAKEDDTFSMAVDVIVIDGTWEQARKLYKRYIANDDSNDVDGGIYHVCLSNESLQTLLPRKEVRDRIDTTELSSSSDNMLFSGRQLRRHPEPLREIATVHALQLLMQDMDPQNTIVPTALSYYQQLARDAAKAQLGPPRLAGDQKASSTA